MFKKFSLLIILFTCLFFLRIECRVNLYSTLYIDKNSIKNDNSNNYREFKNCVKKLEKGTVETPYECIQHIPKTYEKLMNYQKAALNKESLGNSPLEKYISERISLIDFPPLIVDFAKYPPSLIDIIYMSKNKSNEIKKGEIIGEEIIVKSSNFKESYFFFLVAFSLPKKKS